MAVQSGDAQGLAAGGVDDAVIAVTLIVQPSIAGRRRRCRRWFAVARRPRSHAPATETTVVRGQRRHDLVWAGVEHEARPAIGVPGQLVDVHRRRAVLVARPFVVGADPVAVGVVQDADVAGADLVVHGPARAVVVDRRRGTGCRRPASCLCQSCQIRAGDGLRSGPCGCYSCSWRRAAAVPVHEQIVVAVVVVDAGGFDRSRRAARMGGDAVDCRVPSCLPVAGSIWISLMPLK